ncbi:MAG: SET domain-containing protein [Polyangiaceae bacterium]
MPPRACVIFERPDVLHPDTELRFVNPTVGHGVFALRPIPRGTITWARDRFDQVFSPAQVAALGRIHQRVLDRYGYQDGRGDTILCWDHGRYVNHSCEATCLSPGFDFEIAVRDIPAGGEITDDYGTLSPGEAFVCACGTPGCRGTVHPDDYVRLTDAWDRAVAGAFAFIRNVEQPLWELVRERDQVASLLDAGKPPPSGRVHQARAPR